MSLSHIEDTKDGEIIDNTFLRMGSYGAAMTNCFIFVDIVESTHPQQTQMITQIMKQQEKLIPVLVKLNIIGFFKPIEWLNTKDQGRLMTILLYFTKYPESVDKEVIACIHQKLSDKEICDHLQPLIQVIEEHYNE
tara:strand:+ start:1090 stop:1497 length:408 start_codon:yes stop_codon:yes gene_type:complete